MSFLTVYFFSKSLIWDESFCRFGGDGGGWGGGMGGGAGRGFWEESDDLQGKWIGGGSIIANRVLRRDLKFHVNEKKTNE